MSTTETLGGMHLTGRKVAGAGSELAELEREDGALCTAIILEEQFRTMKGLIQAVELARGFMEFPMVTGLVEMSSFSTSDGALIYPTGPTRSVTEIVTYYRETGSKFSKRAALELLYLAGQVLQEAADTGPVQGVYSHGDLTPSRILVKEDGDVQIIGYGLPSPEVLGIVQGAKVDPRPEALAYAPPERLQGAPEDVTSDLYSLACIAVEMITHSTLFDGTADDIKNAHIHGEGPQKIARIKRDLGDPVAEILTYCLHFDPRNRYADGNAFVQAVGALLEGLSGGESLEAAVKPVHARTAGKTRRAGAAASMARGRSIRAPEKPQAGQEPAADGRWAKSTRGRKEEEVKAPVPEPEEEGADRRRRRRRFEEEPAAPAAEPEGGRRLRRRGEAAAEPAPAPAAEEAPRRRLRRGGDEEAATPAPAPTAPPPEPAAEEGDRPRRRMRRGGEEESAAPEPAPAPAAEEGPRRRLRRGGDEEVDATDDDDSPRRRRLRRGSDE